MKGDVKVELPLTTDEARVIIHLGKAACAKLKDLRAAAAEVRDRGTGIGLSPEKSSLRFSRFCLAPWLFLLPPAPLPLSSYSPLPATLHSSHILSCSATPNWSMI
jgi:hypothetical protein